MSTRMQDAAQQDITKDHAFILEMLRNQNAPHCALQGSCGTFRPDTGYLQTNVTIRHTSADVNARPEHTTQGHNTNMQHSSFKCTEILTMKMVIATMPAMAMEMVTSTAWMAVMAVVFLEVMWC